MPASRCINEAVKAEVTARVNGMPIVGRDPYRAYDWRILVTAGGEIRQGAMGRTDSKDKCRENVVTALDELPAGVLARGEIVVANVLDPGRRRLIEVAVRALDGSILWTRV